MDGNPMNKRTYPLILIDRSCAASYPYIFVAVFDQTVGFVARVIYFFHDEQYNAWMQAVSGTEKETFAYALPLKRGGVVLVIEDFFYEFDISKNRSRISSLMKKAIKKVLHAEVDRTPNMKDIDIDNQILQQKMTIERAKANYDDLMHRSGDNPEVAKYQIALAEATLETLKKFRDNQKYFSLNLN